jgi:uncharacterized protein
MADFRNTVASGGVVRSDDVFDAGLRSYMLGVYNYMAGGVALTGLLAYLVYSMAVTTDPAAAAMTIGKGKMLTSFGAMLFTGPMKWVVMLSPLAFVIFFAARSHKMSVAAAQTSFWAYSAIMGVAMSWIFLVFTGASISNIFFITAATFASLSIYGLTTKRDMTAWGTFLFMGMVGCLIAALVNIIFLQSSAMQFALSCLGVLIFAGFTAYDTQRIKDDYIQFAGNSELAARASIFGALALYQDFVFMFQNLLTLFGDRE